MFITLIDRILLICFNKSSGNKYGCSKFGCNKIYCKKLICKIDSDYYSKSR